MMEYGQRSPIGSAKDFSLRSEFLELTSTVARQERLLQGLMREIVRLTGQKQPLQVGVPLYPFSHHSLFKKDEGNQESPSEAPGVQPPLPVSPSFNTRPSSSGHIPHFSKNGLEPTWPAGSLTPPNTSSTLGVESNMHSSSSFAK